MKHLLFIPMAYIFHVTLITFLRRSGLAGTFLCRNPFKGIEQLPIQSQAVPVPVSVEYFLQIHCKPVLLHVFYRSPYHIPVYVIHAHLICSQ